MKYTEKLNARIAATRSNLCVGLDPRMDLIEGDLEDWLAKVTEETLPFTAVYKPNIAYFEVLGSAGIAILEQWLANVPEDVPVILDCKRSDIGETQKHYAMAYFETMKVDAVTLNPFLGYDTVEPFLGYAGKAVYLLAVTSNAGSEEFEKQKLASDGRYAFEHVQDMAERAADLPGEVGLVVGLTNATDEVRSRVKDLPLLMPGLGAQGGDLAEIAKEDRSAPIVVNVSRGILFKEPEKSLAAKAAAFAEQIRAALG